MLIIKIPTYFSDSKSPILDYIGVVKEGRKSCRAKRYVGTFNICAHNTDQGLSGLDAIYFEMAVHFNTAVIIELQLA